jgi:branched-chain amino acid transport system ATP-binding protein
MALLEIRDLTIHFGGLCAVSDFQLDLAENELVGVIGPNGAGKTTVFNMITGIYKPTRGKVSFDGTNITGMRPNRITAHGIARTFQNIRLFKNLSVLDNVRVAHYARMHYSSLEALFHAGRYRSQEAAAARDSMELLSTLGLAAYAGEIASNLPYGQQRRLEIARALATRPKLLLLDEPAAGMNPNEINSLMELILKIRRDHGLTILLIEHQMRLVMGICERIKVLDFGITIAEGVPTEIQNNPKVLEAYLGTEVTA